MTTREQLAKYKAALEGWQTAVREKNILKGSERPEPPASQFGLCCGAAKWAAAQVREQVLGKEAV